jgi:TPR repeat protein
MKILLVNKDRVPTHWICRRHRPFRPGMAAIAFVLLLFANTLGAQPTPGATMQKQPTFAVIQERWGKVDLDTLKAAAEKGDATAQFWLGWRCERGMGVPKSRPEAERWVGLGAEQGLAAAQYQMGMMARVEAPRAGQTSVGNYPVAAEWFLKAAQQDHAGAMLQLGELYYDGNQLNNPSEAAKWLQKAAAKGVTQAAARLGELYRYDHDGVPQNLPESLRWFQIAAEKGVVNAQYQLGLLLLEGEGVTHDRPSAQRWLESANRNGDARAAVKLAELRGNGASSRPGTRPSMTELAMAGSSGEWSAYALLGQACEEGWEGPPDYALSVEYYEVALNRCASDMSASDLQREAHVLERLVQLEVTGRAKPTKAYRDLATLLNSYPGLIASPQFQCEVAELYYDGKHVPEDWKKAVDWFTRAAQQGSAEARNRIGALWAAGLDGAPDAAEAVRWYRKAANQGLPAAQYNLGRALLEGIGVQPDPVEAWAWADRAAKAGHPAAAKLRSDAERKLDAKSLSEAQKRSAALPAPERGTNQSLSTGTTR